MRKLCILVVLFGGSLAQTNLNLFACPSDWVTNGDRCYLFSFVPLAYDDAARACQSHGAFLLSVEEISEHIFISNHLKSIDLMRNDWFTSGKRDTSTKLPRYTWASTAYDIPLSTPMWISENEPYNQDVNLVLLVYKYDTIKGTYGVAAISNSLLARLYICEISRNEVYKIGVPAKGFDYGVLFVNRSEIKRGPKFVVEATNTIVITDRAAQSISLECIATGTPLPTYQWFKYNSGVVNSITSTNDKRYTITNGKLSIQNSVEMTDAGIYQCQASNSEGAIISQPALLSFAHLDEFPNINPAPIRPYLGHGAVIECPPIKSRYSQAIVYNWRKSFGPEHNQQIYEVRPELDKHIFVSGNGKLYFSEVTHTEQAYYYCVATLTTANLNQNVIMGSSNPSRISRPIFLDVRGTATGEYHPRIQDSFISVVPGLPVAGMKIRLECFAYGTFPLEYSWEYPSWDSHRHKLDDANRVLSIDNVQPDDSGTYVCSVVNRKQGNSDRKAYTLNVESKPKYVMPLLDQHLDVGTKEFTWRCEAKAVPFPTYTWYKDGSRIQRSDDSSIVVLKNMLVLKDLKKERDEGMYQCMAENVHGISTSIAQLRILSVAPTFAKYPMSPAIIGSIGGSITIQCHPEAAPVPEIQWFKDGASLSLGAADGEHLRVMAHGDLRIRDMSMSDQGLYECKAINFLGEARNSTYLSLIERSTIVRAPLQQAVQINQSAFLDCSASYNENKLDIVYQWAFNGRMINFERSIHYRRSMGPDSLGGMYIIFAQFENAGLYTCLVITGVDSSNTSAIVTVSGPPSEPAGLQANVVQDQTSSVVLRWTDPVDTHNSPVSSYMIYGQTNYSQVWKTLYSNIPFADTVAEPAIDSQRRQYILTNLKPGCAYIFKIRAVNDIGIGEESRPTDWITMAADVPLRYPDNIGGGGGSVGTLKITWTALPEEDHQGWGIGYEVEWRLKPPSGSADGNIKWNKDIVHGNVSEFSTLVGADNYYLEYEVKVTPFNFKGKGPTGYNDTVFSAEDLPIAAPAKVSAVSFNESAFIVSWNPVPDTREVVKGRLLGFKVYHWQMVGANAHTLSKLDLITLPPDAVQSIFWGNISQATIIGLKPDSFFVVAVVLFNGAGNGPISEANGQWTDKYAPWTFPQHVTVYPHTPTSVRVTFRGIGTTIYEERLTGYKLRYWRDTEDIRNAVDVDTDLITEGIIDQIQPGSLYHVRALGYSQGGDGKLSSPDCLFSVMNDQVMMVQWDPSTSDVIYMTNNIDRVSISINSIIAILFWIVFRVLPL